MVSGFNYYMCLFVDNDSANTFSIDKSSTNTTIYYKVSSTMYDTPGDTLYNVISGWNAISATQRSVYVTITP